MATVFLAVLGNVIGEAVGGPPGAIVGQTIGATIGSYIDSQVILPAVLGNDDPIQGNHIKDLTLTFGGENNPVPACFGPSNMIGGTIIWQSGFTEVEKDEEVGGKGGGGTQTIIKYLYYIDLAIAWCEGPINSIKKIWADDKVIYDNGTEDSAYTAINNYLGTETQAVDGVIDSQETNVPGYRGVAYTTIEQLNLKKWGNRIPRFRAEIEESTSLTISYAIKLLCARTQRIDTVSMLDVSSVTGNVRGLIVSGIQTALHGIEPLTVGFDLIGTESGEKLVFVDRGSEPTVTIDADDLAAHPLTDKAPVDLQFSDMDESGLPTRATVSFIEPDNDYQDGSQSEAKASISYVNHISMKLPLSMTAAEARAVASRMLWEPWLNRRQVTLQLPLSYISLEPADYVTIAYGVRAHGIIITQVERGLNGVLDCEGYVDFSRYATYAEVADDPDTDDDIDGQGPYAPVTVHTAYLDVPAVRDDDAEDFGMYVASIATDPDADWRGVEIWRSKWQDGEYTSKGVVLQEAYTGYITNAQGGTALPDGPIGYWDRKNTVDVYMRNGTLSSSTMEKVLSGYNWAWIGDDETNEWELIGFVNATLVATRTYRLGTLLRGMRDTGRFTNGHALGDIFVLAKESSGLRRISIRRKAAGYGEWFKCVAEGEALADVTGVWRPFDADSIRAFSPARIQGFRNNAGDLTIRWERRTRALYNVITSPDACPDLHPNEHYRIKIMDGANEVRRFLVDNIREVVYTAVQQASDFGDVQSAVTVRVNRKTGLIGHGHYGEAIV